MVANRNALKKYAPQARLDFIQAMTNRAALFGITRDDLVKGAVQGDLFILNGKAYPRAVAQQRDKLAARIQQAGFDQVMEAVAYTWFNRFLAIRYMEIHDYFEHGMRVLSHPAGGSEPQILQQAATVELPGLNREEVISLKLDGTKDEQLYRKILIAQCNDLHRAMPFLFERIDDETELLLPENLLQSDSIVAKLVGEIDEAEWQEIEIIGWLYQFYISDKKDQVIGKVVKSEDIPAATQLFTPNWIVKYMVQNSLGAQWLATYPESPIREQMAYYIAPAKQTQRVQAQIVAMTPKNLDPEEMTLIDPAVGSGHILVEAYDLFRAIYLERGYTAQEAARAILAKNLFGLDIDDRAAQMAGFALLMKARADDRNILRDPPALNVLALQDSSGYNADALADALLPSARFELLPSNDLLPETLPQPTLAAHQPHTPERAAIRALVELFDGAKIYGSLIIAPDSVTQSLPVLEALLARPISGDMLHRLAQTDTRNQLVPLLAQAHVLGRRYDCVVTNPPYMGSKYFCDELKKFCANYFPHSKADTYGCFIEKSTQFAKVNGFVALITFQNWMFLQSFFELRRYLLDNCIFGSLIHIGRGVFGADFGTCSVTIRNTISPDFRSNFRRLFERHGEVPNNEELIRRFRTPNSFMASANELKTIPGFPIAYWATEQIRKCFRDLPLLETKAKPRQGLATGDNNKFLRFWYEINHSHSSLANETSPKWFPYSKGGEFRKWYGNDELLVDWENNGEAIENFKPKSVIRNPSYYFREAITWSLTSMHGFSARFRPRGAIFDVNGMSAFPENSADSYCGLLNSKTSSHFLSMINPTIAFQIGDIARIPVVNFESTNVPSSAIALAESDWDAYETSWDFTQFPLLQSCHRRPTLAQTYTSMRARWQTQTLEMQRLEETNNRLFIDAYGLIEELSPDVALSEITLTCNPHYRYGGDLTDDERETRLRSDTMRELVSYAIGCTMGRFSLIEPGLIYADAGNVGFDATRYGAFPADYDGIVPLTEVSWFTDDASTRIEQFLALAWPDAPASETLVTLTDGLSSGKGGDPHEVLRTYLSKTFYTHHLQTYKNRPIYWLFSSGKLKAFECLVYLHRYNEGTLARVRTEYVAPLMGKFQQRIGDLEAEVVQSNSSAEKNRKSKEAAKLAKQLVELRAFDEELRHLADQRIALNLDDGVKLNYGRFGNLLAAKDKICTKEKDE